MKRSPEQVLAVWDEDCGLGPELWKDMACDLADALREVIRKQELLQKWVWHVIENDRFIGGTDLKMAYTPDILPGDSVMVADLLRGLGCHNRDYP